MQIESNQRRVTQLSGVHLSKLYTFEVAARHRSFALAAQELCLTPSAVSHQMSKLERDLGVMLFDRQYRTISLTTHGQRLYQTVSDSLLQIGNKIEQVKSGKIAGGLTVFSRPSFAAGWLAPRIATFCAKYPSIELNIVTGNDSLDLRRHGIDVAIYFSDHRPVEAWSTRLVGEKIIPVCSASYAELHQLSPLVKDLSHCTLLYDNEVTHSEMGVDEWQIWQEQYPNLYCSNSAVLGFDQSILAVTAAANSGGIAMGRWSLVKEQIASGCLVTPLSPNPLESRFSYYLVAPYSKLSPEQQCFVDWIFSGFSEKKALE
ncbi:DNA-binding transcriptional regulator DsdC [Vibrio ostreicida]|uniref:DNA-binding transcriptional regulator DsdC n=1 Tax=Vibrio ostreicida TaxID=526588 RepID=A0ABT8BX28_9VIBR|nr:DNA-binding transcriptional regulator DsdC [Vibrio ostreicida]MDN3611700.1 DNA-binding transcriptional regulator DsdC [Vibrio ostreicida]NPD10105.1 DNA-binding transcriptional regulator DsdC [Vibrio ostreicida]